MKPNVIILTVPHSVHLENVIGRTFDTNALNMARLLKMKFETHNNQSKEQNIQPILIESKQNRMILDDNRYASTEGTNYGYTIKANSSLWNELRTTIGTIFNDFCLYGKNKKEYLMLQNNDKINYILSQTYPNILIIDCHSFPIRGFGNNSKTNDQTTGQTTGQYNINEEHKVVILDYTPYQKITQLLTTTLNNNGIKTSLLEG